jgi:hypothetical protein
VQIEPAAGGPATDGGGGCCGRRGRGRGTGPGRGPRGHRQATAEARPGTQEVALRRGKIAGPFYPRGFNGKQRTIEDHSAPVSRSASQWHSKSMAYLQRSRDQICALCLVPCAPKA